jgi:hypothetical protein
MDKPQALVVGKPLCSACLQAEHDLTELGFDVAFLNGGTPDGMAWLADHGHALDESLVLPVVEIRGWPEKQTWEASGVGGEAPVWPEKGEAK